ncbi:MAG: hypothetical protein ABW346_05360, partial [Terrimicrobium sp.]
MSFHFLVGWLASSTSFAQLTSRSQWTLSLVALGQLPEFSRREVMRSVDGRAQTLRSPDVARIRPMEV